MKKRKYRSGQATDGMSLSREENGIALITVLSTISLMMLLVGATVAISQTQRFATATATQLSESVYLNESALNRAIWLLMADRSQFTDRELTPESEQIIPRERFRSDNQPHFFEVSGISVEIRITDMNSGINLSGYNPVSALSYWNQRAERNGNLRHKLEIFKNRLMDYVDSDELLRLNSMERADYESLGMMPLPRDVAIQFREEVLWIPGGEDFINPERDGQFKYVNLTPPRGLHFNAGAPHFFSAVPELIRHKCDFTDHELETVLECRQKILGGKSSTEEAFAHYPQFLELIKKQFSVKESPFYTITVRINPEAGIPGRTLTASLRINTSMTNNGLQFYQWQLY